MSRTVDIYNGDEFIHSREILSDFGTVYHHVIYEMCQQLVRGAHYTLVLKCTLDKLVKLSGSNIGSITVKSLVENKPCLISVALGENKFGTIKPRARKTVTFRDPLEILSDTDGEESENIGEIPVAISMFEYALDKGVCVLVNNFNQSEMLPTNHPIIRSFVCIPLACHPPANGLLTLANRESGYTEEHISSVSQIANMCGYVIAHRANANFITGDVKTKANFLTMITHELLKPLDGISSSVVGLLGVEGVEEKGYVKKLTENTTALVRLINNILDFTKMTSGQLKLDHEEFCVMGVISDVIGILSGFANSKHITLAMEVQQECIDCAAANLVIGDKQRLTEVLLNLTNNAIKFTDKGSVKIIFEVEKLPKTECKLSASTNNQQSTDVLKLMFHIVDTGMGIPVEDQDRLFEVLHQVSTFSTYRSADASSSEISSCDTNPPKGGTGLGLAIVRELVTMMNGDISISSEGVPGKGSTFSFYVLLPIKPPILRPFSPGRKRRKHKRKTHRKHRMDMKILIIEDNEADVQAYQKIFFSLGYRNVYYTDMFQNFKKNKPFAKRADIVFVCNPEECDPDIFSNSTIVIGVHPRSFREDTKFDYQIHKPLQKPAISQILLNLTCG